MQSFRRLFRFLRPYWKWATLAPLFMVLEVALDLLHPRLIQRIIDEGIGRSDLGLVVNTSLWMAGIALLGVAAGMLCAVFAVLAAQNFGADVRRVLFEQVQSFSFGNLDQLDSGSLITRLTNDVNQVQEVMMMLLRVMVRVPLLLVGSLIMAILTSPQLALLFVPLLPFVAVVLVWIINKSYPLYGEVQRRLDGLNTVLQENLAGVRVVKAFARMQYERDRFAAANTTLMDKNIKAARVGVITLPVLMLALNGGVVAALWFGGIQVSIGGLQAGQVLAFVNYLMQTLMALMSVSMLIVRVSRAEASSARIGEVLDNQPHIHNSATAPPQHQRPFELRGRVAFEQVNFGYGRTGNGVDAGLDAADLVLQDLSFVAEPGQTVAILGATGVGKTSLVQLIPRFYDVTGGRVTLDGVDVREIDEHVLRGYVGIALQESVLFSGSIRDNIRYGRPEATDEQVVAAAKAAQADDFIRSFPDGYGTLVGQRGVNLSGGQKQRMAIARALLTEPAVLILDDSTSAVDVQTESKIQDALLKQKPNQTRIVVAQRISTVLNADQILVLDEGRLVARGTHVELLATSPIYKEIYESQLTNGVVAHVG